ncbi:Sulfate permease 2, partial [Cladochytrium tenue]
MSAESKAASPHLSIEVGARSEHTIEPPQSQYAEFFTAAKEYTHKLPSHARDYFISLFPIAGWLPRYNLTWFVGDIIAGVTVALVVIPQALGYSSKLATLPAVYGLYSSFFGVLIYALFATTKDVTIGPTAVLSQLVGQILASYDAGDSVDGQVKFAVALSFLVGVFQLFLGLFRFGIIVDFVPVPVIVGFTTGAGVQIIIGQLASVTGIKGVDTTQAPYAILGAWIRKLNTLPSTKYDLAFGISTLAFILIVKYATAYLNRGGQRPVWKYIGLLRNGVAIIIFTGISYAIRNNNSISIVGTVPVGLSGIPKPDLSGSFLGNVIRALPSALIVSILEHIAVAKSYGRINGYRPNDNQELVAIGITNLFGAFLGAYPATGSFSRSAIKSQSGVRSPMAAFFTAIIILIALYTLTGAFYFIPSASLAAVVIASVTDLFIKPQTFVHLYQTNFIDFVCFWIGCLVTFFSTIEIAIYASVGFALVVLLVRVARPKARQLVRSAEAGWIDAEGEGYATSPSAAASVSSAPVGIVVYRPYEALTYPNSSFISNTLKWEIFDTYRYSGIPRKVGDRNWNDDLEERTARSSTPTSGEAAAGRVAPHHRPLLRAVVLDFSAVNGLDYTGLQALLDLREDLARYAGRNVPFHFAHVRRDHLKVVWGVPGTAPASALDPVNARPSLAAVPLEQQKATAALDDAEAGRHFHLSVDEAVRAADAETAWVLDAAKA